MTVAARLAPANLMKKTPNKMPALRESLMRRLCLSSRLLSRVLELARRRFRLNARSDAFHRGLAIGSPLASDRPFGVLSPEIGPSPQGISMPRGLRRQSRQIQLLPYFACV